MKFYLHSQDIDCGGNMANLWWAINHSLPHQCRMSIKRESRWEYKTDLIRPTKEKVKEMVEWADIVIVHGFPCELPVDPDKPLYFWDMCNWETDKCMSEDYKENKLNLALEKYKAVITFAPHHAKIFERGTWLPPLFRLDKEVMTPDLTRNFEGELLICQSPSGDDKNTPELKTACEEFKNKHLQIKLNVLNELLHDECLAEKRKHHILFDNIRQGWWGQAGYEALSQGLVVFARLEPDLKQYFENRFGFCPVEHINNIQEFKDRVLELYNDRHKLKQLCERNRKFIIEQYPGVVEWLRFMGTV